MQIPQAACDGMLSVGEGGDTRPATDLEIGAMFIHEFLHSHFYTLLEKLYNGSPPEDMFYMSFGQRRLKPGLYHELYGDFVNNVMPSPPPVDPHAAFFLYLAEPLLNSLHQLNGGQGEPSDYLYYFHILVNTEDSKDNLELTDFNLNDFLPAWQGVGGALGGTHPLFDSGCID